MPYPRTCTYVFLVDCSFTRNTEHYNSVNSTHSLFPSLSLSSFISLYKPDPFEQTRLAWLQGLLESSNKRECLTRTLGRRMQVNLQDGTVRTDTVHGAMVNHDERCLDFTFLGGRSQIRKCVHVVLFHQVLITGRIQ